jgi:hypothetical protein
MKNLIPILILIVFTTTGCSNRIVLKKWDGNVSFREGDEVLFVLKNQIDTLPKCNDQNIMIDSLKGLKFKTIFKIEKTHCSLVSVKEYKYDTLSRSEGRKIEKANKEYRKAYYRSTIYGDSGWANVYQIPIFTTPEIVQYDSIDIIIEQLNYSECDSYFIRRVLPPLSNKRKLYRWKIEKEKLKVKGKH